MNIYQRTIRHWEVDILGKLERAKSVKLIINDQNNKEMWVESNNNRKFKLKCWVSNCPLCTNFRNKSIRCEGCPLSEKRPGCGDTPYNYFYYAAGKGNLPETIIQCKRMIAHTKNRFKKLGLLT